MKHPRRIAWPLAALLLPVIFWIVGSILVNGGGARRAGLAAKASLELAEKAPEPDEGPGDPDVTAGEASKTILRLGAAPADTDTQLDHHLDSVTGVKAQCAQLNELIQSTCCSHHGIGCDIEYVCERLTVEETDLMKGVANHYARELPGPGYTMNHGSVLRDVTQFLRALELYGKIDRVLPVAYTSHSIYIDDESTSDPADRIDPTDPSFQFLGVLMPGLSGRGGRRIILDYWASRDGLFLTTVPSHPTNLARALAEYRAGMFTFREKQLTDTGVRDLYVIDGGDLVPNFLGCQALCAKEPL